MKGLLLALLFPALLAAQQDSTSTDAALLYGASLVVGVTANAVLPFGDRDAGGYEDRYRQADKALHLLAGQALTAGAVALGADDKLSATFTCLGGYLFEHTQALGGGYVSNRDAVAVCAGAWGTVGARWLLPRLGRAVLR